MTLNFMKVLQDDIGRWCERVFGVHVANDREVRAYRFFEEATELVQAIGLTRDEAHMLVDYVYGRPVGEVLQEIGGTGVTLLALCAALKVDFDSATKLEFNRCDDREVIAKIIAKQQHKPNPPSFRWSMDQGLIKGGE
jgi:hypothetical protein